MTAVTHDPTMQLIVDVTVTAAGQFEGTIDAGRDEPARFSGTLELLRVLEDATRSDLDAAGAR